MQNEDNIENQAFQWVRAKVFKSNKTFIGRAIAYGCATRCHMSVHSLALSCSGSTVDLVVLGRVLLGVVHAADATPRVKRTFPRGGGFSFLRLISLFLRLQVVALMMAV